MIRFLKWLWRKLFKKADPAPGPAAVAKKKKIEEKLARTRKFMTITANYCLTCGKPLARRGRQIVFFCSRACRKKRHNKKRG